MWSRRWESSVSISLRAGRRSSRSRSQLHADWAITLACGATCPYVPTTVEDWDIPDPAGKLLEEIRAIRDAIDFRVRGLMDHKLELIRADKTAHRMRLERLIPPLAEEFEGLRSDAEIRTCANAILARYDEAAVRSHVLTLAHR